MALNSARATRTVWAVGIALTALLPNKKGFRCELLSESMNHTFLSDFQRQVAEFVRLHDLETDVCHRLLDLVSELGEVAKENLKSSGYGKTAFRKSPGWDDEMGDVFFSLICVANSTQVDLSTALSQALAKYSRRMQAGKSPGSKAS